MSTSKLPASLEQLTIELAHNKHANAIAKARVTVRELWENEGSPEDVSQYLIGQISEGFWRRSMDTMRSKSIESTRKQIKSKNSAMRHGNQKLNERGWIDKF